MGMEKILVIGIAGGSGSGKTTLMRNLTEGFGDGITVLSHDNYYRAHDELPFEQRSKLNYDHPDAFDTDMMVEHLKLLKQGCPIDCPVYDYAIHNRTAETIRIVPKSVIIVEGILIFENRALCDLMDVKIFVDTDADVRLIRRIKRDVAKRGRSLQSVLTQYLDTVKPMHEQFVEPSKKNADLVVLEGGKNLVALEMIMSQIRHHIASCRSGEPAEPITVRDVED
jgi:uridine kinase